MARIIIFDATASTDKTLIALFCTEHVSSKANFNSNRSPYTSEDDYAIPSDLFQPRTEYVPDKLKFYETGYLESD